MSVQNIIITGTAVPVAAGLSNEEDIVKLKSTYVINGSLRGATEEHDIKLDKNDLVELLFEDNTTWYCNRDTIEEVFPEALTVQRSIGGAAFKIPAAVSEVSQERGIVSSILLKGLNIFTKKVVAHKIHDIAADFEQKQLEHKSGLYFLTQDFQFREFSAPAKASKYLLFLHGTASSAKGSFGELMSTDLWPYLFTTYGDNVIAFQHETLTKSPLENVLDLVKQLPGGSSVDMITHSRGGLLGDILARFCNTNDNNNGFDKNEIDYLVKVGRIKDKEVIEQIQQALETKKIYITKYIRVACPAQGTVLASKRMDNFFNVVFNLIGVAGGIIASPAYLAFKNLMGAIIDSKNDEDILPGLEAMNPESPFIKVLNSPASNIIVDSRLVVVSGNCKSKLNLKALVIIASKLFFAKDNDLVVNTGSMYSGSRRSAGVQYIFDDAQDVDHFHYFKNKRTNDAILAALKAFDTGLITGFTLLDQGSLEAMQRNALLNLDGGQVYYDKVSGNRPIAIIVPGIMGSNLSENNDLIWINYLRFISGGLKKLKMDTTGDVEAPSLVSTSYKKLAKHLLVDYDVITYAFDWRLQLNEIAALFNKKIKALLAHNQPIKIIGHSMGGVMVRDFIIQYPDTWQQLNAAKDFKLVFLGAPLGGSFRIPFVLFGRDAIIDKLSKIDIFNSKKDLLGIFNKMPGLLSLLPLTTDIDNDFSDLNTWDKMAESAPRWPLPDKKDLTDFGKYRKDIIDKSGEINYDNISYIAGKDDATPCGYRNDNTNTGKELVFLSTVEGDQSVTWESGIPKQLIATNAVYYANVSHGSLANEPALFQGIGEIISNGSTTSISKTRPVFRGIKKVFVSPEQHDLDITPEGVTNTLLSLGESRKVSELIEPLKIIVTNGDLKYAAHPIIAGHFNKDGILNAELAIDHYLNMALSIKHQLNLYPGLPGTSDVFISDNEGFKGAIIVGLGKAGELTAYELTNTIEQGVCNYILTTAADKNLSGADGKGISALMIGSGYGGLSVENSVRSIIEAVHDANARVKKLKPGIACITQIEFIELYEDAALNCLYAVSKIEKEKDNNLPVEKLYKTIRNTFGKKQRIQSQTTDGWWNRITVSRLADESKGVKKLAFSSSTGGATEARRELLIAGEFMETLLDEMSDDNNFSKDIAKTIFELLIPNDFKDQLKKRCNIDWIVDRYSAEYPWELLWDITANDVPLAVSAGMIRQYGTEDYRTTINFVTNGSALVIGDPDLSGGTVPQLPGAKKEAELVRDIFTSEDIHVESSINGTSTEIIKKMFSQPYKIIHLAGHGMFDEHSPKSSGMLIGNNTFLSSIHIRQMSNVPELVFVNCCFLGKTSGAAEDYYKKRYKLAANLGTQLLENGVKAVVAAGWAVDDEAAYDFTRKFYEEMFEGAGFGEAIQKARKYIYDKHGSSNTWGAYQCYGDAFYKFDVRKKKAKPYEPEFLIAQEAEIELNNLMSSVEMGNYDQQGALNNLEAIDKAINKAGLNSPALTEKEAFIYAALYENDLALQKFKSIMEAEKASFSVGTLESYCSLRSKKCIADFEIKGKVSAKITTEINSVIDDLKNLLYIGETSERFSLIGSAYKRKAFLTAGALQKIDAIKSAALYYKLATDKATEVNPIYPLTNWYEMESLLVMLGVRKWKQSIFWEGYEYPLPSMPEAVSDVKEHAALLNTSRTTDDYWEATASVKLDLCIAIINPAANTQQQWNNLLQSIKQAWAKVGAAGKRRQEIEHLQILLDAIAGSRKKEVMQLRNMINELRDGLKKMIA